jgi:hypothetical protein
MQAGFGLSLEDHQRFRFDIEKNQVTAVSLVGDSLVFSARGIFSSAGGSREVTLPSTLLEDFTDLAESDSGSILDFAQRWGRLGLCNHGLPATHSLPGVITQAKLFCDELSSEELEDWRLWARKFKALWRASMSLHIGEHADQKDWALVFPDSVWTEDFWLSLSKEGYLYPKTYWDSRDLIYEWGLLLDIINYYVDLGGLRLRSAWTPHALSSRIVPRLAFGCPFEGGLFGTLALQLMFAVSNTEGAAICTSCGRPFFPKRRPKTGQRRFCSRRECGRKAANRHAARDFRKTHPKLPSTS